MARIGGCFLARSLQQKADLSPFSDRCGGAPRSFRGFDLQNNERRRRGDHGSAPNSGRSPFTDGMPFPDMGSPVPLAAFDPVAVEAYGAAIEGEESPLPDGGVTMGLGVDGFTGPGSLELDEVAAAAATTPVQSQE